MRPIIGITTPDKRIHLAYLFIKLSVWLCGGRPVPLKSPNSLNRRDVKGLVVGGGTDVFPGLFQRDPKQDYLYDHARDEMEMAWLKKAEQEKIPVLAICRGAQMMNVMHKGTLHLDVSLAYENAHYPKNLIRKIFFRKPIEIEPESLLYKLVGYKRLHVNSMHMQSIDQLGEGLKVTAREDNGVVQAIEGTNHPFCMGVQFHPEFMIWRPTMRAIFKGLMQRARS